MFEIVFPIVIGIIGMLLGIKVGFEHLARDLYVQSRLKPEEFNYISSGEYFWKSFKIFNNDRQ